MRSSNMQFALKWNASDPSTAIILTFDDRWRQPLSAGDISAVFRKRCPSFFIPTIIYAYFAKPSSAIAARFPVISWERQPLAEAVGCAGKGRISPEELRSYAKGYDDLLVITIGQVEAAQSPVTHAYLCERYDYWPSSTFTPLSGTGVKTIDALAHFKSSGGANK